MCILHLFLLLPDDNITVFIPLQRNGEWRERKCERARGERERIPCKDITTTPTLPTELEVLNKEEKDHFWGRGRSPQGAGWGSPRIAEARQEREEAGIKTRSLPPKFPLCKPVR